jgi:replicative DNA helicase
MFFTVWHKGMKDADCDFYNQLITNMEKDVSESIKSNLVNQLVELEFVTDAANVAAQYEAGDEVAPLEDIRLLLTRAEDKLESVCAAEFSEFDESVVDEVGDDSGLKWPLEVMNRTYRNILPGDQYIIAASPGQGKTSFLTFLIWSMVQQMADNKIVVWFNNESKRQRIMSRQMQSALNVTNSELKQLKSRGELTQAYIDAMGSTGRVRVYDVHGKDNKYLERVLQTIGKENVGAIIFDMLDNVRFPTAKELREDQRLEKLYQWARERGVEYDCATFPTSQVSNEGKGLLFPSENMLKDSKVGKQGACDGIIMIGHSDDPMMDNVRGLSMPKTKSKRDGQENMREEVLFDGDRGRFK